MGKHILIKGGLVCDGSGTQPKAMDILVKDGRINALEAPGTFDSLETEECICAAGKIVAPGFIDAHSHGDTRKLAFPENRSKLLQGVTTEVDGNCGMSSSCVPGSIGDLSWLDLGEYTTALEQITPSTNTVVLCGHNSIRQAVMGNKNEKASQEDLKAMQRLLEASFEHGAAGWSSGLTYFPGKFSDTNELVALSSLTRGSEKIYATHMRSEGDTLFEAIDEAVEIAAAGSERLQISHFKTIFPQNYGKLNQAVKKLENARADGRFIYADRYPYIYSSTRLGQVLPMPYFLDTDIASKLKSSDDFCSEVENALKNSPRDLPSTIIMAKKKTIAELAEEQGCSVERACMLELKDSPDKTAAYLCMSEENMLKILALPWVCAGSDGISMPLDDPSQTGHPRAAGTFPRFFRLVSFMCGIGEAIRRMTSLPAEIFRIPERGLIRKGYIADLVVFDSEKLDSKAGFRGEDIYPAGIELVMVAGKTAWDAGTPDRVGRHGRFININ